MLNKNYILKNTTAVRKACEKKGVDKHVVDDFIKFDTKRLKFLVKIEGIRAERNKLNKGLSARPSNKLVAEGKKLKQELSKLEEKLQKIEQKRQELWLMIPNVPSKDTPEGKEDKDKKKVFKWGEVPKFDFEAKDHIELGKMHNLIELERGSKVAGFRGYFLSGEAVLLQQAILQYALNKLVNEKGYKAFTCPTILKKRAFVNTGHFPWGEKEAYEIAYDDKKRYLAGTSEVGMVSYHQDELLDEKELPLKYVCLTPCFRKEAGSYGKDTKGLYRLHEFMKVEQVIFCRADQAESDKLFEELNQNAQEILQDLGLAYRVCLMPAGDMGEPQYKKYDIETWMPSRESYGETMSCSNMLDFQSRRANIKYRDEKNEKHFVYTLNNTAIATPRILISLLETYQQKDGSIEIPKVLRPLVGKDKITKPIFK